MRGQVAIHKLGYGVMVTLQILVLPFLVRVRVSQLSEVVIQEENDQLLRQNPPQIAHWDMV